MPVTNRWRGVGAVAVVLVALAGTPGSALAADAQSSRADRAETVIGTMDGRLEAGPAEHFAYYRFAYPGGWPMTIELRPPSADKAVLR
jgi:hypothetical protein